MKSVLGILLLCCLFSSVGNAAQLSFNAQNTIITFDEPVKLADVLAKLPEPHSTYWAGAGVYELDSVKAEGLRAETMSLLASLIREQSSGSERYILLSDLYREISDWQLMRRLNIDVDYDQARLNPKRNPGFIAGRYYIKAKPSTQHVSVVGQIDAQASLAFSNTATVRDYLDGVQPKESADNDFVYVIEPNGNVTKQGVAYWNDTHYKPMPGSVIFLPLQTDLFSDDIELLNDKVARLLQHRM